jgi:hypothetical protein
VSISGSNFGQSPDLLGLNKGEAIWSAARAISNIVMEKYIP